MTDRNVDSRAASLWEKWMQLNLEKRRRSSSGQGADVRKKASKEDSKEKNDQVPVNTFFLFSNVRDRWEIKHILICTRRISLCHRL